MATITGLWQTLFRLAPRLPGSDRELLARFAATRDQPAFTELVRRHGGLVWSVCRRHLREPADAEDAFQATFLVLATRPQAVRRAESLGAWLHGTAWRVSARLRRQRGRTLPEADRPAPPDDPSLRDALVALDEELVRLPAKFREPLTACYLLECTQDEAARDLGVSVRTVKRRLATGRELLRQRLGRRGVELGAVLAALALRAPDAPAVLVQTTLTAAALGAASATVSPLVQGVLVMMWQAKLKAWAVGLGLTAATLGGTGYLATTGVGQGPPVPGAGPAKVEKPAAKAGETPFRKLSLDADDLAELMFLDAYKFQLDMPKGQVFNVILREVNAPKSATRWDHRFEFRQQESGPTTLRIALLRSDRKLASFLLSNEKEAEFRVDCSGGTTGGVTTIVSLPLTDVPVTQRILVVGKSNDFVRQMGLEGVKLLTVVVKELPAQPRADLATARRAEVVVELGAK